MARDTLRDALPEAAKDTKLNLGSLANDTLLTDQQKWRVLRTCARALGVAPVLAAFDSGRV
jgi:alkyl hydroperoxide reductase subunit D